MSQTKNILILGADGFIGRKVTAEIRRQDDVFVIASGHTPAQIANIENRYGQSLNFRVMNIDVSTEVGFNRIKDVLPVGDPFLDHVIYCVGHCPPGGIAEEMRTTMTKLSKAKFYKEFELHPIGAQATYLHCVPLMRQGGSMTFMSSAAPRLLAMPFDKRPQAVQIYGHLAAITALDATVEGYRMDPDVKNKNLLFHLVKPPAISDSPFHAGGPPMPVSVIGDQVVHAIMESMSATVHETTILIPPQAAPTEKQEPAMAGA